MGVYILMIWYKRIQIMKRKKKRLEKRLGIQVVENSMSAMIRQTVSAKNLNLYPLIHYFSGACPRNTEWGGNTILDGHHENTHSFIWSNYITRFTYHHVLGKWEEPGKTKEIHKDMRSTCIETLHSKSSSRSKDPSSRAVRPQCYPLHHQDTWGWEGRSGTVAKPLG